MTSRTPLEQLKTAYADRFAAARAWKNSGGKVIGYISNAVPRELIEAADCFPLLISGDVDRVPTRGDEWMEEQFDPMARSIFDMAVSGELDFLDLLIVPRVADSFLRLYLYLREIERLNAVANLPKIHLFDLLQTRHFSSGSYNRERVAELGTAIEAAAARPVTADGLRAAIRQANAVRDLQRQLASLRRATPPATAGSIAIKLYGANHFLRTADYTALLSGALSALQPNSANSHSPRIVIAGNAQSSTHLHEMLEARGLTVVGDYHWLGDPLLNDIVMGDDPWLALSDHYHCNVLTSRRYPHEPREIVEFAQAARADGVVFYLYEQEEALTWDCPHQIRELTRAGIASVVLQNQPYRPEATPAVAAELDVFAAQLQQPAARTAQ
jgi:benzoyl-CoA reductase/2-hydroxyglutaryl-CoA dehydratase subunit BcrC/BadD/HgdB